MGVRYRLEETEPRWDDSVFIAPGVHISGDVEIGPRSSVWFNTVIRGDNAPIRIGEASNIQDGCVLHVDADAPMTIGNRVTVGHGVILHGCTIHDGALIGMGAIVLNHAEIGEEALIGAGTLIPEGKRIPPRVLVLGSPGRVVRALTEEDLVRLRQGAEHYVQQSRRYMRHGIGGQAASSPSP
ncbi:gamma carbonic anhydrase family protein [Alicyclobacillus sp.]|uniref:gamma carbonic anhydrase family protein n=1 Tax=Alicyclobacillus sp. TaxID=61169 RepID=UPI0025B9BFFD|nr:gamma carbonic anhydrase family protein [Alicyclobacillus sp.]MCL6517437.1 gamma carbonic anhydrase family protein [Alicyclobacillus sp.]